jgi:hypothetical protein
MLSNTAKQAIKAYGGEDLWMKAKHIEALVSVNGLAFTLKRRTFFNNVKIEMAVDKPFSKISPIGEEKNITGVLDGKDTRLENPQGDTIAKRQDARGYFRFNRRLLYWDDLDMSYFANYAFWNYFTLPRLLLNDKIKWQEKQTGVLFAEFPNSIPTHSKQQEFYFDVETGLLVQHNYTARIISRFAKAANKVVKHSELEKIKFPSYRVVTPRVFANKSLNSPALIVITVHKFKVKT